METARHKTCASQYRKVMPAISLTGSIVVLCAIGFSIPAFAEPLVLNCECTIRANKIPGSKHHQCHGSMSLIIDAEKSFVSLPIKDDFKADLRKQDKAEWIQLAERDQMDRLNRPDSFKTAELQIHAAEQRITWKVVAPSPIRSWRVYSYSEANKVLEVSGGSGRMTDIHSYWACTEE
jgi:hypothetical protein